MWIIRYDGIIYRIIHITSFLQVARNPSLSEGLARDNVAAADLTISALCAGQPTDTDRQATVTFRADNGTDRDRTNERKDRSD